MRTFKVKQPRCPDPARVWNCVESSSLQIRDDVFNEGACSPTWDYAASGEKKQIWVAEVKSRAGRGLASPPYEELNHGRWQAGEELKMRA